MATAAAWISACTRQHPICDKHSTSAWQPRRLVSLHAVQDEKGTVRIVDTTVSQVTDKYNTLSHRWGINEFLTLSTSNKEQFELGMDVAKISQTYQYAIRVCKAIEVQYIWIDSLCIVQDDAADGSRESVLMTDVYSNAHCNVSATASDGTPGMFRDRDPVEVQRIAFSLDVAGSKAPEGFDAQKANYWVEEVEHAPLHNRA